MMKGSGALESGMIGLEEEMFYRRTAGSPHAPIQYWQVSQAESTGKRISVSLLRLASIDAR
jgi:hypothetical protein